MLLLARAPVTSLVHPHRLLLVALHPALLATYPVTLRLVCLATVLPDLLAIFPRFRQVHRPLVLLRMCHLRVQVVRLLRHLATRPAHHLLRILAALLRFLPVHRRVHHHRVLLRFLLVSLHLMFLVVGQALRLVALLPMCLLRVLVALLLMYLVHRHRFLLVLHRVSPRVMRQAALLVNRLLEVSTRVASLVTVLL